MGLKRPFDYEEVFDLPFQPSRQLECCNKLYQFDDEVFPCYNLPKKPFVAGEGVEEFCQSEYEETCGGDINKDFETSAPFSWATTCFSEDDARSGATTQSSLSQENFGLDFQWRTSYDDDDDYSFLLDRFPRKQVPIGPNHQADIPVWRPHVREEKFDRSGTSQQNQMIDDEEGSKLMGECIIPMPTNKISEPEGCKVGEGRTDCLCMDRGSIRCVRQHMLEARKELLETTGHEKFVKLGFCDMGEEAACKWCNEEEELFRKVVYSNPVSLGRNFWKHLRVAFPSRTMNELVSYYFNVFILLRRAIQNRSKILDIDSDDDDWHESYEDSNGVRELEEDEDSAIESPFHSDSNTDHERGYTFEEEDDEDDDDDDGDDDGDGCEGDVRDDGGDSIKEYSLDDYRSDPRNLEKISDIGDEIDFEDDSCMSFDSQSNKVDSLNPVVTGTRIRAMEEKTDLGKHRPDKFVGCNDLISQMYLFDDTCNSRFPTSSSKDVDFLPTCNIIEEIFGQETLDDLTRSN